MRVIKCEPNKQAEVVEVGEELEDLQEAVGGYIEIFYPFEEDVCIVCNEEGKINGSAPCRVVWGINDEPLDVIYGAFIICGDGGEDLVSLTDEQVEHYLSEYGRAESF